MRRLRQCLMVVFLTGSLAGCGALCSPLKEQTRAIVQDAVSVAVDTRGEVQRKVRAALDEAFEDVPNWREQVRNEVRRSLEESGLSFAGSAGFPEGVLSESGLIGELVADEFHEVFQDGWFLDGEGKGEQVEIQDADGGVLHTLTDRAELSKLFDAFQLDKSQLSVLPQNARVQYVCVVFQQRTRLAGDPPDAPVSLEQTAVLELYDQPYLRMDIDGLRFTFQIPADAGARVKELLK